MGGGWCIPQAIALVKNDQIGNGRKMPCTTTQRLILRAQLEVLVNLPHGVERSCLLQRLAKSGAHHLIADCIDAQSQPAACPDR